MLSLHDATEDIHKLIKWGIISVVAIIFLIILGNIAKGLLFRPKPIEPTMTYGLLPMIPFPKSTVNQQLSYALDTVDGHADIIDPTTTQAIPIPSLINIYKITHDQPTLTSLQSARDKVLAAGFVSPTDSTKPVTEQRITDTEYHWDSLSGMPRSITMDIGSFNFHLTSQYLTYPAVLNITTPLIDSDAINLAQNYLSNMNINPADVDTSLTTTTDYVIQNDTIRPALTGENVLAIGVNFFQKAVDGYTIYYPNVTNSTMSFLITNGDVGPQVSVATYVHQNIDLTNSATYPLKTSDQAYTDLKMGNGYIAPNFTGSSSVNIRTINLGYYLGEANQDYLMPIYIFQGDNNFTAYISALSNNVISTASASLSGQ